MKSKRGTRLRLIHELLKGYSVTGNTYLVVSDEFAAGMIKEGYYGKELHRDYGIDIEYESGIGETVRVHELPELTERKQYIQKMQDDAIERYRDEEDAAIRSLNLKKKENNQ